MIIAAAFAADGDEYNMASLTQNALRGAQGTALVDMGFLIGMTLAIALASRWGRIPLQITGCIGCAVGLLIAADGSAGSSTNLPVIVTGFILY